MKTKDIIVTRIVQVLAILLLGSSSTAFAKPAVYWWHMPLNVTQAQAVARAKAAVASGIPVQGARVNSYSVVTSNDYMQIIIYCAAKTSSKTEVVIFVSADNEQAKRAKYYLGKIRDDMK